MRLLESTVPSLAGTFDEAGGAYEICSAEPDAVPTVTYDPYVLLDALFDAYNEARDTNWDGEGAHAVSADVLGIACRFLLALPAGTPEPEVDASPHGTLLFSWYAASRRRLTVDVSDTGDLAFAAVLGHDRVRGTMLFIDAVPDAILRLAARVTG